MHRASSRAAASSPCDCRKKPLPAHTALEEEPPVVTGKALLAGFRAHAFIFGVFWRHLASRSLQRFLAGAAFEWTGMLAPLSFWACDCAIEAMPSDKANITTISRPYHDHNEYRPNH
jgi:hypothetical protein